MLSCRGLSLSMWAGIGVCAQAPYSTTRGQKFQSAEISVPSRAGGSQFDKPLIIHHPQSDATDFLQNLCVGRGLGGDKNQNHLPFDPPKFAVCVFGALSVYNAEASHPRPSGRRPLSDSKIEPGHQIQSAGNAAGKGTPAGSSSMAAGHAEDPTF